MTLASQCLEQVTSLKYLGIYINDHLSWYDHITHICDKIFKCINIMIKVKCYLGLTSIYYSLIYPYLIYGCILWAANNYENPLLKLIRFQNKAIKIINDVPLQDHITPHDVNLALLKFHDIVKMYSCLFFYDHLCDNKLYVIS